MKALILDTSIKRTYNNLINNGINNISFVEYNAETVKKFQDDGLTVYHTKLEEFKNLEKIHNMYIRYRIYIRYM